MIEVNSYYTLIAATMVLLLGKLMVSKIKFLRDFNIPEPVAGGLVAAICLFSLHAATGIGFQFQKPLQDAFMLIFFTSIGLSADFSRLKAGGIPLVVFTAIVGAFIFVQNIIGVGLASVFGLHPMTGLITGSITLTGGHGTAAGWAPDLIKYGVPAAAELGMASATFGLVAGGQHGSIVVAAHEYVGNVGGIQNHHHGLNQQDNGYFICQTGQLPQLQVQQGHGQEERERGVAEHVDGTVEHIEFKRTHQYVAQHHAAKQRPYEFGQVEQVLFVDTVHNFGK